MDFLDKKYFSMKAMISFFSNSALKWSKGTKKDKILILIQSLAMALSAGAILLSRIISFDGEISKSISDELIDNFDSGFFMNFTNMTSGNIVKFGKWQGTLPGCGIIKDGKKQAKIIKEGKKCKKGEEYLEGIFSQDILTYKNISLSASTKGNYYELLYENGTIIKKNERCPKNKTQCGYIDTLKNILCIDKGLECPISYVKFQNKKPYHITNINVITGNKINFYFSSNPYENSNEIPFIVNSFKIADSTICAIPNLYYSKIPLYYLDGYKSKFSTNCVLKDYSQKVTEDRERYHAVDTVDNYELYEENHIIDKIKNSKLIEYGYDLEQYKNNRLTIYVRTHFGFDKDCLDRIGFKKEQLAYIYGQADKMITYGNWAYFTLINMGFCFLILFNCTNTSLETIIKTFINTGTSFILIICSIFALSYDDYYVKEMTCSEVITNNNYNIMISKIKKSGQIVILTLIIYILNLISKILMILLLIKKKMEIMILSIKILLILGQFFLKIMKIIFL